MSNDNENGKTINRAELSKALAEESSLRAKRVYEKIAAILEEEDCTIQSEAYLKDGLIYSRWGVFAKR